MKICNTEDFFHEVALRVSSNLEIDEAIKAAFNYMSDFIPMDMMGVYWAVGTEDGGFEVFSVANHGQELYNEPYDINKPILSLTGKEAREIATFDSKKDGQISINNWGNFPLSIFKISENIENYSIIQMEVPIGDSQTSSLVLAKEGRDIYHQRHVDLLLSVMEPFSIAMNNAIRYRKLQLLKEGLLDENQAMRAALEGGHTDVIVGADFGLRKVMEMVRNVSKTSSPVLLFGETGTGKEVIAKNIHQTSERCNGPFVRVQCGAMPETLLDSELFGHEKGAFTGAVSVHKGRFERANGGTIFLDEIGELSLEAQVKLLRVLQEKEFERVGGNNIIKTDVRIIAATHRNLRKMVQAGKFREDLWFRLNIFPIELPPLRERKEDIYPLVQYYMTRKARELNLPVNQTLAPGTIERLIKYDWPGNLRELQNLVERGLIISRGHPIEIPESYFLGKEAVQLASDGQLCTLDELIKTHLCRVIDATKGKIEGPGGAAEILALNPSTLRGKLRKYKIPFGYKA